MAKAKVGQAWEKTDISFLLGGWTPLKDYITGELVHGAKTKWKADLDVVKALVAFLASTGRFMHEPKEEWQTSQQISTDHRG